MRSYWTKERADVGNLFRYNPLTGIFLIQGFEKTLNGLLKNTGILLTGLREADTKNPKNLFIFTLH